ncbi:MAG: hypothetical protein WD768_12335 [Phycisphaeraceae bacterium]
MKRSFILCLFLLGFASQVSAAEALVTTVRVPDGGLQPQVAVDEKGTIHLIYFKGEPRAGDAFYVTSKDSGATWSKALRVNSEEGSVVAAGNIRGAQLAIGKNGRAHVAWMGSMKTLADGDHHKAPMLYARLNDKGDAFEAQRNVITKEYGLDGGGSIAASTTGDFRDYLIIAWHAGPKGEGESKRRVWVTVSSNDGLTFQPEFAIDDGVSGVCACCGIKAAAQGDFFYVLYRCAKETVHRDMMLSKFNYARLSGWVQQKLEAWNVATCPMSSAAAWLTGPSKAIAWEAQGRVSFAQIEELKAVHPRETKVTEPVAAPRADARRNTPQKHPSIATDKDGRVLLAWSEGVTWGKGGNVLWQVFDADGKPVADQAGTIANGVPVWSLVAACAKPGGGFILFH